MLAGAAARWLSALGIGPPPRTASDRVWDNTGDRVTVRIGVVVGVFICGMLSELIVSGGLVRRRGAGAGGVALERATITDVPGLSFWVGSPREGEPKWRLTAAFTVQPR